MKKNDDIPNGNLALNPVNYLFIGIGFIILLLGFFLMSGGGSTDSNSFDPSIFSVRRITIAPIVLVTGFFFEIFAIIVKKDTISNYLSKIKGKNKKLGV